MNDYYGCAFTLNSSTQCWTCGTSKPWASPGGDGHFPVPGNWD